MQTRSVQPQFCTMRTLQGANNSHVICHRTEALHSCSSAVVRINNTIAPRKLQALSGHETNAPQVPTEDVVLQSQLLSPNRRTAFLRTTWLKLVEAFESRAA